MPITLNHTIVHARNPAVTAAFITEILGIEPARRLGHFTVIKIGDTSLDLVETDGAILSRHFAFLVSEDEFDTIFKRIRDRESAYWADPHQQQPDEINHWDDGRGVYFEDPNGHLLEILTRPYGSGGCEARYPHPLLDCP